MQDLFKIRLHRYRRAFYFEVAEDFSLDAANNVLLKQFNQQDLKTKSLFCHNSCPPTKSVVVLTVEHYSNYGPMNQFCSLGEDSLSYIGPESDAAQIEDVPSVPNLFNFQNLEC